MLKMIHLYFDKQRVDYFFDTVTSEFWDYRICGPKLKKQAMDIFTFTNRFICTNFVISSICVLLFLMFPVADMPKENDRILPNVIWTPFDLNPSPLYEIVFTVLLTNGILTYIGNIAYDFFYLYCVQHLVVQFMLLKELLTHLSDDIMVDSSDVEKFNSVHFQRTIMDRLKICAEHHSRLLK